MARRLFRAGYARIPGKAQSVAHCGEKRVNKVLTVPGLRLGFGGEVVDGELHVHAIL